VTPVLAANNLIGSTISARLIADPSQYFTADGFETTFGVNHSVTFCWSTSYCLA
jgi:hypothetical protein